VLLETVGDTSHRRFVRPVVAQEHVEFRAGAFLQQLSSRSSPRGLELGGSGTRRGTLPGRVRLWTIGDRSLRRRYDGRCNCRCRRRRDETCLRGRTFQHERSLPGDIHQPCPRMGGGLLQGGTSRKARVKARREDRLWPTARRALADEHCRPSIPERRG
jgi:hypothetical protein